MTRRQGGAKLHLMHLCSGFHQRRLSDIAVCFPRIPVVCDPGIKTWA